MARLTLKLLEKSLCREPDPATVSSSQKLEQEREDVEGDSEDPHLVPDMVEVMLLQNAQMHQVIMQSLMLQAVPPMASASSRGPQATLQWPHPTGLRAERQKPPSVHHHHHYAPPAPLQAAPGSPVAYSMWPSVVSATALPPAASFLPTMRHLAAPSAAALST
ncbi:hypothetical protein MDA_GLEAN10015954 [Myotis davidii]|uniref:DUF4587 domain-containing protein n=1 Tax=Myotis davidii TaxID=225400 RepID=L5M6M4_MYODS|nr:hypothetical protein MDA_GLEAN10015954 [Myotis davidii]